MKTTLYIAVAVIVSFIVITPSSPKEYPSEEVQVQQALNALTERKIENYIDKLDYQFKIDSIHLKQLKNEESKKR